MSMRMWEPKIFTAACEANTSHLVVDTPVAFRPGKTGEDGEFALSFVAGLRLTPSDENGRVRVLRRIDLDDPNDPHAFKGFGADGVEVVVPFSEVAPADVRKLLSESFHLKDEQIQAALAGGAKKKK